MPKYELIKSCSNLLDIFHTESDEMGVDILEMSNFFNIFVSNTISKIGKDDFWEKYNNLTNLMGEISIAIQSGLDISNMGTLIADSSHFSKEIIEGLKSGIYHIGESKEVSGNYRPAILDENEHLVKFFTLKKANNPFILNFRSNLYASAFTVITVYDCIRDGFRNGCLIHGQAVHTGKVLPLT